MAAGVWGGVGKGTAGTCSRGAEPRVVGVLIGG